MGVGAIDRGLSPVEGKWMSREKTCLQASGLFWVLSTDQFSRRDNATHISARSPLGGAGPGVTGAGTRHLLCFCSLFALMGPEVEKAPLGTDDLDPNPAAVHIPCGVLGAQDGRQAWRTFPCG